MTINMFISFFKNKQITQKRTKESRAAWMTDRARLGRSACRKLQIGLLYQFYI